MLAEPSITANVDCWVDGGTDLPTFKSAFDVLVPQCKYPSVPVECQANVFLPSQETLPNKIPFHGLADGRVVHVPLLATISFELINKPLFAVRIKGSITIKYIKVNHLYRKKINQYM